MTPPADLAACCPAASERRSPALARARAAVSAGRHRAGRAALTAHLVLRRVPAAGSTGVVEAGGLARLRSGLEIPGGPGEEAGHLLLILDGLAPPSSRGGLTRALTGYAVHLESEGHFTEALLVLERLLSGLTGFASDREAVDLSLLVARLDVTLGRWQPAERALAIAECAGAATETGSRDLVALIRATAWVGQGRINAARELIEPVQGRTDDQGPSDRLGSAWSALGTALEARGLPLEALQAHHRALQQAADGAPRRRVLASLGNLLRGLGAGSAARQAFTLALAGPIPFADQVAARLELLDLAIALGDRVAFERQRRELTAWQERLPPAAAVEFLTRAAGGLEEFGQVGRADRMLLVALGLAERHELHDAWFGIDRMLHRNRRGPQPRERSVASVIPLPWEHPEIAEVAEALERQAATEAALA
ncbi:MAG: hypothetical protein ABJC74_17605 [Gemmatimonadota bacterium]